MIIKRYIVNDMKEAMIRIRYELGSEAIIISKRAVRQKGIFNFFKKKLLEVTAAVDDSSNLKADIESNKESSIQNDRNTPKEKTIEGLDLSARVYNSLIKAGIHTIEELADKSEEDMKRIKNLGKKSIDEIKRKLGAKGFYLGQMEEKMDEEIQRGPIQEEIVEIKKMIGQLIEKENGTNKNTEQDEIEVILNDMDVDRIVMEDFITYCDSKGIYGKDRNKKILYDYLTVGIQEKLIVQPNIDERVLAFVGPTGVGKTTTIAKIAARESIINKKNVGLITIDTYRIGAVEQLKTYANILGVPMEVVVTKDEFTNTMERLKDCDLILIDSTGRSYKNDDQLQELESYLKEIKEKNTFLVLSVTTKNKDLFAIMENYKKVGYDNIILTKFDETQSYGNILNVCYYTKKPICYITTGQDVPDDLEEATSEKLAQYLWGEIEQ